MKKIRGIICAFVIAMSLPSITVSATTLDDVINEQQQNEEQQQQQQEQAPAQNTGGQSSQVYDYYGNGPTLNEGVINDMRNPDFSGDSSAANKVNAGIKRVATVIIKILSYGITILMVVRVMLDLTYISLPFTRSILANGYGGQAMGGQPGMGQPGMGGTQTRHGMIKAGNVTAQ